MWNIKVKRCKEKKAQGCPLKARLDLGQRRREEAKELPELRGQPPERQGFKF